MVVMKHIASVSWGKDSLAMLLLLIDKKLPLDEVVFYDTGMEFQAIYNTRDKVVPVLKELGIKYTELKPTMAFRDKMFNYQHMSRKGEIKNGYGWCGGMCRWGTTEKLKAIDKYCKEDHQYIGLAFDEPERLERLKGTNKSSPLAELGYTEEMCLKYCYDKGFKWLENGIELYSILTRVSCWCCRNKNLKELANYKKYLKNYWDQLIELEILIGEPMKKPIYLKDRFKE